jgi:hypothetical protein
MPNGATNVFSKPRRTSCSQPLNNAALNGESLVGDLPGMGEIGFRDQDRLGTVAAQLREDAEETIDQSRSNPLEWLIEHEQPPPAYQSAGERYELLLATAELQCFAVAKLFDLGDQGVDACKTLACVWTWIHALLSG